MPFCNQCGNRVADADKFCGACGTRQPPLMTRPAAVPADPLSGVSPRTLSILCYVPVMGWIASVIVLGARRFRTDLALRFHAFQGLYIFAAWLLVDWGIQPLFNSLPHHVFRLDHLLQAILIGVWIFMLIKTSHGKEYSLPILGELAHRSANERT